jgi:hypothetical protein
LGRVAEKPVAAYDSGVCSTVMNQQPYTQEDLNKVAEFATITLRAIAPRLQDIDLSNEMQVDCMASDIAKACYAMGVCMIDQHEATKEQMGQANKSLYEINK